MSPIQQNTDLPLLEFKKKRPFYRVPEYRTSWHGKPASTGTSPDIAGLRETLKWIFFFGTNKRVLQ
jgi:hypothetical protein